MFDPRRYSGDPDAALQTIRYALRRNDSALLASAVEACPRDDMRRFMRLRAVASQLAVALFDAGVEFRFHATPSERGERNRHRTRSLTRALVCNPINARLLAAPFLRRLDWDRERARRWAMNCVNHVEGYGIELPRRWDNTAHSRFATAARRIARDPKAERRWQQREALWIMFGGGQLLTSDND
jgi:hypothetical protein